MKINIYPKDVAHHLEWLDAFAQGLTIHGQNYDIKPHTEYYDADLHVFWSMHHKNIIDECRKRDKPFICLERGYIDRMNFSSINLNGLNGLSELCLRDYQNNIDRINKHKWYIKPRIKEGNLFVVAGQVPHDYSLLGIDTHKWAYDSLRELDSMGFDVVYKPHPLDNTSYLQSQYLFNINNEFEFFYSQDEIKQNIYAVLTYSSNYAVDSWMNGIRALSQSPISMIHKWQTDDGKSYNSKSWLCDLSFRQYNIEEMQKGEAWQIVKQKISEFS